MKDNVIDARKLFERVETFYYRKIKPHGLETWSYTKTFDKDGNEVDRSKPIHLSTLEWKD